MLFAIGAASSAIDLLKTLTSPGKTTSPQGAGFSAATTAASDSVSKSQSGASRPSGNISPQTLSALLDAQSQSTSTPATTSTQSQSKALKDLFNLIDGNGDGSITKSEFADGLGAGGANTAKADSVFGKLDSDGNGSVSLDELSSALKGKGRKRQAEQGGQIDPLLKALDEADKAQKAARAASSYTTAGQAVQRVAQTTAASNTSTVSVSA